MNLQAHFESYRASARTNVLEGFLNFAKACPTAEPTTWPTVDDYLRETLLNINNAITDNDESEYKRWLGYHQKCLVSVFEKMVEEEIQKHDDEDREVVVLNLTKDKGWNWYKFSKVLVEFDNHKWIPRYAGKFLEELNDKACFDADELNLVLSLEVTPAKLQEALDLKAERPVKVTDWDDETYNYVSLGDVNAGDVVHDWSMRLFKEG